MTGGAGTDMVVFAGDVGRDVITDFRLGTDSPRFDGQPDMAAFVATALSFGARVSLDTAWRDRLHVEADACRDHLMA